MSLKIINLEAGSVKETAWAFVGQHLDNIPTVVIKTEKIELVPERQTYLLFDKNGCLPYHTGHSCPYRCNSFTMGWMKNSLRDGMYFLPDQVNEYDTARIKTDVEPIQFEMFVTNEKSAISWLYQRLGEDFDGLNIRTASIKVYAGSEVSRSI